MHLPKFEHLCPSSIEEAAQLLGSYGDNARLVAGGTDLFPRMKQGLTRPEVVISLKGLSIDPPRVRREGDLYINALMPLADIPRSPEVQKKAPMLAEAITSVGSNQIRHMGTLGGNICLENRCTYYNQLRSNCHWSQQWGPLKLPAQLTKPDPSVLAMTLSAFPGIQRLFATPILLKHGRYSRSKCR